jgi:hypothetical protein
MICEKEKNEASREHGGELRFSVVRGRKDLLRTPSLSDNSFCYWLSGESWAELPWGWRWFPWVLSERADVNNPVNKMLTIC